MSLNRKGQATVEYILILVVIVSTVAGLVALAPGIEQKFESSKLKIRDQIAGKNFELKRRDFFTAKIKKPEESDTTAGGAGGAGGSDSKGGKNVGATDTQGVGASKVGTTGTQSQAETQQPTKSSSYAQDSKTKTQDKDTLAKEYKPETQVAEESKGEKDRREIEEREFALASAEEKERILRRRKGLDSDSARSKPLVERDWGIGKFIIIIMIILFFIVIILKTRRNKD